MNKIEVVLGASVLLFSALSILLINYGVVPSRQFPGYYTYSLAHLSRFYLFPLTLFVGLFAIGHGGYRNRLLKLGLGIIVELWGLFAWFWVALILIDGGSPYIKGSISDNFVQMSLLLTPGLILGIALMLDGILRKSTTIKQRTQ